MTIRANIALLKKRIGPANVAEQNAPATADAAARKVRLVHTGSNSHDLQTSQTRIAKAIVATPPRFLPAPRKPKLAVSKPVRRCSQLRERPDADREGIGYTSGGLPAGATQAELRGCRTRSATEVRGRPTRIAKATATSCRRRASRRPMSLIEFGRTRRHRREPKPLVEPLVRPQTPPRKPKFGSSHTIVPETGTAAGRTLIAEAPAAPQLRLLPIAEKPQVAATTAMALEVSNGTDRPHLALRVSDYFAGHGYQDGAAHQGAQLSITAPVSSSTAPARRTRHAPSPRCCRLSSKCIRCPTWWPRSRFCWGATPCRSTKR